MKIIYLIIIFISNCLFSQSFSVKTLPVRSDSSLILFSPKMLPLQNWKNMDINDLKIEYSKTDFYNWNVSTSDFISDNPFEMDLRSGSNYIPIMVQDKLNLIMDRDPGTVLVPAFVAASLAMQLASKHLLVQKKIEISPKNILQSAESIPLLQALWHNSPLTVSQLMDMNVFSKNLPRNEVEKIITVAIDNKIIKSKIIPNGEMQLFPAVTRTGLTELVEIGLADTTFSQSDHSKLSSLLLISK